ncbi:MAG: hypothetical protein OXB84_06855 [Halobacteriovoraceae bacterium]|nr:hypothetical protein [Halobacteriovoraceae bacterium]
MIEEYFSSNRKILKNWRQNPYFSGIMSSYKGWLFGETPWFLAFLQQRSPADKLKVLKSADISKTSSPSIGTLQDKSGIKIIFTGGASEDNEEAGNLLLRMIDAMKLKKDEYLLCQTIKEVEQMVGEHRPQVIVSFGAIITNQLLDKKERLSQIHGKFINKSFTIKKDEFWTCPIVPVFHPDFLVINPSMKRKVWMDLQKVIKMVN